MKVRKKRFAAVPTEALPKPEVIVLKGTATGFSGRLPHWKTIYRFF